MKHTSLKMALSVVFFLSSSLATAQEQEMENIVVTGELIERSLQDSQTSIALITGEELERSGDVDLYDVVDRTPGIISSFGEKGFAVRGVDQRSVGGGGTGLTVSTTVDGAIISNSNQLTFFGPYSIWDLGQVEVLRGPQSTQTGRNALAGAVVIRSQDPVYEQEAKFRLQAGERDSYGGALAYNQVLIDNTLAIRISAETFDTDGFVDNPTIGTDEYDARESELVRLGVRWDPSDNIEAIFKFSTSENTGGEDLVEYAGFPGERVNLSDFPAEEGSEMDSYNLRLGVQLNDKVRLDWETTYYDADYFRFEDSDSSPTPGNSIFRTSDVQSWQTELKLGFEFEQLVGVVGLFYTDFSDDAPAGGRLDAGVLIPPFAGLGTITAAIDQFQDTENYAIFGEVEYALTDQLRLVFGARYDHEDSTVETVNSFITDLPPIAPFLPPSTTEVLSEDFSAFLPKIGLVYAFNDEVSLGFTVQEGYRAGGVSVNLITGVRNTFDPEETLNYELSLRTQWPDSNITFNGNLFYTDWNDQIISVPGESGLTGDTNTINAGESTLYGAEFSLQAQPTEAISAFVSLAFVDTEFDSFASATGDFTGNEFPWAPELTASAGATYYFNNGFYVSADVSYVGESFVDPENTSLLQTPSRTLWNARVGYENDNWQVFAYGRNLSDKDYYHQAVANGAGTAIERVRSGEPRTLGIVATYRL